MKNKEQKKHLHFIHAIHDPMTMILDKMFYDSFEKIKQRQRLKAHKEYKSIKAYKIVQIKIDLENTHTPRVNFN